MPTDLGAVPIPCPACGDDVLLPVLSTMVLPEVALNYGPGLRLNLDLGVMYRHYLALCPSTPTRRTPAISAEIPTAP